jgi:hypothetical protein
VCAASTDLHPPSAGPINVEADFAASGVTGLPSDMRDPVSATIKRHPKVAVSVKQRPDPVASDEHEPGPARAIRCVAAGAGAAPT